jgi:hypothetical protein
MKQAICLNCNEPTEKHFCANCGQKTHTHRITLKHFLLHDLLHGIWHLEKGILFTIKEAFMRPGQAALDYISGKRIRYYNVFYLSLLVIATSLLLNHLYDNIRPNENQPVDDTINVTLFIKNNLKLILLSFVPILGFSAFIVFRKLKLNIAEHFIISGIGLLGMLLMSLFFNFVDFLNRFNLPSIFGILEVIAFFLIPLFPFWLYYNATKNVYSFWGFLWRMITFYLLVMAIVYGIGTVVVMSMLNGKGYFYVNL